MPIFLPGDLIFCHGTNWISAAIQWASQAKDEPQTYANHTAGFIDPAYVVEALWTVKEHIYSRATFPEDHQIWRYKGLTMEQRSAVALQAQSYVGRQYGVFKLFAHLGDAFISKATGYEPYVFRRLARSDRYPICSWVWTYAYDRALNGYCPWGKHPNEVSPDDMQDYCKNSNDWELVCELSKYPV